MILKSDLANLVFNSSVNGFLNELHMGVFWLGIGISRWTIHSLGSFAFIFVYWGSSTCSVSPGAYSCWLGISTSRWAIHSLGSFAFIFVFWGSLTHSVSPGAYSGLFSCFCASNVVRT